MITKTESNVPLKEVEINNREGVGIADIWMRRNIRQLKRTDEYGESTVAYTADEVYFMRDYTDTLGAEITAKFDDWWEYGKTWTQEKQLTDTEKQLKAANERIEMLEECLLEMSAAVYA